MKRTFELIDGKAAKFWQIEQDGNTHTVCYGRIGTKGQAKTKTFADPSAMQKDAEKLIKSKTKKGYVEVEAAQDSAPALDPEALEAQLAKLDADPSAQGRLVFGDWLQAAGHPWGTLITLDHTAQVDERDAILADNPTIIGGLAERNVSFTWQQGFMDEVTITSGGTSAVLGDGLRKLFTLPAARYLRRLVLDGAPSRFETHRDWDSSPTNIVQPFNAVIPALAKAPKTLTELAFGALPPTGASAYVGHPDLAAVAKVLPELEVLEVQCSGQQGFGAFGFAKLRRLEVRFANANATDLQAIRDAKLPALEQLSVWLGGYVHCILDDVYAPEEWDEDNEDALRYPESYPGSDLDLLEVYSSTASVQAREVADFCQASWPASLKHLGIQSALLDAATLDAILSSELVARLDSLDLSRGSLNDQGAAVVVRHAERLAHLTRLDLSRNQLSEAGVKALKAALPKVDCSAQRGGTQTPEFLFRYVATME
ncbi:WGR domain protein [Enhygromyxa salina]|uniref:WGR domain protein n=1 Tax=Enhygromyxa salina TaxID=215803 RepID=A0A2S9YAQ6_9BACT|nr:WGR domain-containing protein [Enhygromyxa salina]PRQ02185.1 WGR domain protein [Enhygromyxa salina]